MFNKPIRFRLLEQVCFFILIIINCSVLLVAKHFPTLDGPAHLYNATILKELLISNSNIYSDFFTLNPEFPPNVFSHVLLILFKYLLPWFIAEKTLILLHLAFTPLFFRLIVKHFNPSQLWLCYLIFPLTHFSLLYMGFYNFTLGILFSIICLKLYFNQVQKPGFKSTLLFFSCLILLYFSHIFVFLILLIFLFLHTLFRIISTIKTKGSFADFIKTASFSLLLPLIPSLVLCAFYLLKRQGNYNFKFMPTDTITWLYTNGGPFQAYGIQENLYCKIIVVILGILSLAQMIQRIRIYNASKKLSEAFRKSDILLAMSFLLIVLSYTMPDEDGYGGYITIRFVLFAFLFLILWLASSHTQSKIALPLVISLLVCHFILLSKKSKVICELDKAVIEIEKTQSLIKDNSSILTFVGYEDIWQVKHFGNYLGADKNLLIFDNYEADAGYFPIVWREGIPTVQIDSTIVEQRCWIPRPSTNKKVIPDYVLAFNAKGFECYEKNYPSIIKNYTLLYSTSVTSLYIKK